MIASRVPPGSSHGLTGRLAHDGKPAVRAHELLEDCRLLVLATAVFDEWMWLFGSPILKDLTPCLLHSARCEEYLTWVLDKFQV